MALLYICYILILFIQYTYGSLNVALHAQISPSPQQIVGSVITTEGLKAALLRRFDVDHVEIFYPSTYSFFTDKIWDVVIIEGWFPSIHQFIWRSRRENLDVIILFYCLDPSYPDLSTILSLDVDGYMTNSRYLASNILIDVAPTIYLPLAADPRIMSPIMNEKIYTTVYIGAGGDMLRFKPQLHDMLLGASRVDNLSIYGSNWDHIDTMSQHWKGAIPVENISYVYSLGHLVLASTIISQKTYGMINNRIYEALACGSLIISDRFDELELMAGDIIEYADNAIEVEAAIIKLMKHVSSNELLTRRAAGRQLIISHHTWDHRLVDVMNLYYKLKHYRQSSQINQVIMRSNCLRVLWLVSSDIAAYGDYISLIPFIINHLKRSYIVDMLMIDDISTISDINTRVHSYDIIIAVIAPYDNVDLMVRNINRIDTSSKQGYVQRRIAYVYGVDIERINPASCDLQSAYDIIMYRNMLDIERLASQSCHIHDLRLQHVFGIPWLSSSYDRISKPRVSYVVICYSDAKELCQRHHISPMIAANATYAIMLIGGDVDDWRHVYMEYGYHELHHLMHFKFTSIASTIAFISSNHHHIILMNKPWQQSSLSASSIDIQLSIAIAATVIAHNTGSELRFWSQDDTVLRAIDAGSHMWDRDYLMRVIDMSFYRLLNFGSSLSRVSAHRLTYDDIRESDSDCVSAIAQRRASLLYRLDYEHFQPGRDGECCIIVNGETIRCMIARFRFLAITWKTYDGRHVILTDITSDNELAFSDLMAADETGMVMDKSRTIRVDNISVGMILLKLRGNLASDFFFETDITNDHHTSNSLIESITTASTNRSVSSCTGLDVFDVSVYVVTE